MADKSYFSRELLQFLKELRRNNKRAWFQANKQRYELAVREPMLRFIADFGFHLHRISRHFVADARPIGGSMFRIHRDIRFTKDKSPYKTHAGAHFSHGKAEEGVHAPGFYLHLEPGGCFAAAGLWHPDSRTLVKVREAIVLRPEAWKKACRGLTLEGESLNRPPRGYDPNHAFVEDLKRRDFVTSIDFSEAQVCSSGFLRDFAAASKRMSPLVEFLTKAVGLGW